MKEKFRISKWLDKYGKDLFVVVLFGAVMLQPITDPDLGWHLRLGKEMAESGKIIMSDGFSFSLPNYDFVNHSWLLDILTYYLYKMFGLLGVNLVYGGLTSAGLWFVYAATKKILKKKELALLIPICAVYIAEFVSLRTHSFSFFGISFLWYVLKSHSESKKISFNLILALPVLFLIWANMHAGFVLGFLVWGLWILFGIGIRALGGWQLAISKGEEKQIMLLICSLVATLINPFGIGVWRFAFDLLQNNTSNIFNSDWVPLLSPRLSENSLIMRWSLLAFGLVGIFGTKNYLREKLIAFVFVVMTLYSIRYTLVFLILITPLLFLSLEEAMAKWSQKIGDKIFMLLSIIVVFIATFNNLPNMICAYSSDECYGKIGNYPHESVVYFRENNLQGNVFNFYTWGGYLEWKFPDNKYFIDGRMDSFYVDGESFLSEFAMIVEMRDGWREVLEKYDVDYVLLPKEMKIVDELEKMGWVKMIEGSVEVVLTR